MPALPAQQAEALATEVQKIRTAIFGSSAKPDARVFECSGPAQGFGMEFVGTMVLDQKGHYLFTFKGEFDQAAGDDGTVGWERNPSGSVRAMQAGNASFQRLMNWFVTSDWLTQDNGFTLSWLAEESSSRVGQIKVDAGNGAIGVVHFNRRTGLPRYMETEQYGRIMRTEIDWAKPLGGRVLPKSLKIIDGGKDKISWQIEKVRALPQAPSFSMPTNELKVSYDKAVKPQLRTEKASGGHLWVRPKINGKDVGWFLFDTGASNTVIDAAIVEQLGMPVIGKIQSTGIGGRKESRLCRANSIQLGGVTIKDVPVTSQDLSKSDSSLGMDVAGYLGVDILSEGIIVYDEANVAIEFHVPASFELPRGEWEVMPIHNNKPAVNMEYEGHVGLFLIDTGAPGRLIFGPTTVKKHQLLEDRKTTRSSAWGTGGRADARNGNIEYVVFGGKRFETIPAKFITETKRAGAGADVLRDGIVGANLLRRFVVVFDIRGERIAYLDHAD